MATRRVINRWAVVLLAVIFLAGISVFKIPHYLKHQHLLSLGYTAQEIKLLHEGGIAEEVLKKEVYSPSLLAAVAKEGFQKKYFDLYVARADVTAQDLELYELLKADKGYTDEELVRLFGGLKNFAVEPLIVFEKVDVTAYLEDNADHPDNSVSHFVLSGDYLKAYENSRAVQNPERVDSFVSLKYSVEKYAPSKLVEIPIMYSVAGLKLRSDALQAFTDMCDKLAAEVEGEGIYAVSAYISYDNQQRIYDDYGLEADKHTVRPGFHDAQLGLSVNVVSSANPSTASFAGTASYKWLQQHAAEYGFIERYPAAKEEVTGRAADASYWRYVGTELAGKVKDSGLSFDEYYYRFLNSEEKSEN